MLLFLYGKGTIKSDGSPDERTQFGALGDISKDALRLMTRIKLEDEHENDNPGDEMSMVELKAMSEDELLEHMRAPPRRYRDVDAVIFKDIFAPERHPSVVIKNQLPNYIPFVDAVPRSRRGCTLSEYKARNQKLWSILTYKGSTQMKELAQSVKSMLDIDLLYRAVLKWGDPGKN